MLIGYRWVPWLGIKGTSMKVVHKQGWCEVHHFAKPQDRWCDTVLNTLLSQLFWNTVWESSQGKAMYRLTKLLCHNYKETYFMPHHQTSQPPFTRATIRDVLAMLNICRSQRNPRRLWAGGLIILFSVKRYSSARRLSSLCDFFTSAKTVIWSVFMNRIQVSVSQSWLPSTVYSHKPLHQSALFRKRAWFEIRQIYLHFFIWLFVCKR